MEEDSDVRVLAANVSRMEGEIRGRLDDVKSSNEKVSDSLEHLRESLPEKFLSRREHEDWRRTVGERVGETEVELAALRKDVYRELERRDAKADATRKLALTGLAFPVISSVTVGAIFAIARAFGG